MHDIAYFMLKVPLNSNQSVTLWMDCSGCSDCHGVCSTHLMSGTFAHTLRARTASGHTLPLTTPLHQRWNSLWTDPRSVPSRYIPGIYMQLYLITVHIFSHVIVLVDCLFAKNRSGFFQWLFRWSSSSLAVKQKRYYVDDITFIPTC